MSQRKEQVGDGDPSGSSVLDQFVDWYHVPALVLVATFMFWVRIKSYGNFITENSVLFSGNDAWYHLRNVRYTFENWPATMPFDPWTYYPYGTSSGQFGTLYDQLVATAAIVVGMVVPENAPALTLLFTPAVFGALAVIPTYLIGKRLGGRNTGVLAAVLLSLLPGTFLQRTLVGFSDHNGAEPFFQGMAVAVMLVALVIAEREKPVWELVLDRDYDALRRPVAWSALSGFALAAYLWMWPPGVLLVGIFAVFFAVKLTANYVLGESPEHLAFVGATAMATTGFLTLVSLRSLEFSPTQQSLLQPGMTFAVAGGAIFIAWLSRYFDDNGYDAYLFPVVIGTIVAAGTLVVAVAFPDIFNLFKTNIVRFIGFNSGATARTIGEAKPFLFQAQPRSGYTASDVIMREYGLLFFTALVTLAWLLAKPWFSDEHPADEFLVVVWSLFIVSAAFTQIRFNYYLALPVAILNAYAISGIVSRIGIEGPIEDLRENVETYQIISLVFVVLLVLPVLVVPVQLAPGLRSQTVVSGSQTAPGTVQNWDDALEWMRSETPIEGEYGGADNELEYYGSYQRSDDFAYEDGTYGVMAWWDYGHWLTVLGERIPNANPFQQGAREAANFLLAPDEKRAEDVVGRLSDTEDSTRYVVVDYEMVSVFRKFSAPTVFYSDADVSRTDFVTPYYTPNQNGQGFNLGLYLKNQRYYESMMIRMYLYHGSAKNPEPTVVNWDVGRIQNGGETITFMRSPEGDSKIVRQFDTMAEAEQFVQTDGSAQIGGIRDAPTERVSALQHYRLVKVGESFGPQREALSGSLGRTPSWVKIFERVPGGTIQGTGPADTEVKATVQMRIPTTNQTFTYTQYAQTDENGDFEMVVPYSTTGYADWGTDEGYTNVSVRAVSQYDIMAGPTIEKNGDVVQWRGTVDVPEANVIGEDDSSVEVTLESSVVGTVEGAQNNSSASSFDPLTIGDGDVTSSTSAGSSTPLVDVAR